MRIILFVLMVGVLLLLGSDINIMAQTAKEEPRKVLKTEYTYNTKITEYDNGVGNAIIYGGLRYANSSGQLIEDAYSLKYCEFCDRISLSIQHTELKEVCNKSSKILQCWNETIYLGGADPKWNITIIDYNYTNITIIPHTIVSELNKDIPLKVYSEKREFNEITQKEELVKEIHYDSTVNIKSLSDKQELTLPFGFDYIIHYGDTSTTLKIDTTNADVTIRDSASQPFTQRSAIRFDISSIPSGMTILNATLVFYIHGISLTPDSDCSMYRMNNQSWTESISASQYDAISLDLQNTSNTWNSTTASTYTEIIVKRIVEYEFENSSNDYVSFTLGDPDAGAWDGSAEYVSDNNYIYFGEFGSGKPDMRFCDSEETGSCGATHIPYLMVDYEYQYQSLNITFPITSNPKIGVSNGDMIHTTFAIEDTNENQTTGITYHNVTVGTTIGNFVTSDTTTDDSSTYQQNSSHNLTGNASTTDQNNIDGNLSSDDGNTWDITESDVGGGGGGSCTGTLSNCRDMDGNQACCQDAGCYWFSAYGWCLYAGSPSCNQITSSESCCEGFTGCNWGSSSSYFVEAELNTTFDYNGGNLTSVNVTMNLTTSVNNDEINSFIYNFVNSQWNATGCTSETVTAGTYSLFYCNKTINPEYYNDTNGVVRIRINSTQDSDKTTLKIDSIEYMINTTSTTTSVTECGVKAGTTYHECNFTAPNLGDGTYDFKINVTYDSKVLNDTESNAITYGAADSCSYSSGNWVIEDNCTKDGEGTINVCPNFVNITCNGFLNLTGATTLNASKIYWCPSDTGEKYRLIWELSASKVYWGGC